MRRSSLVIECPSCGVPARKRRVCLEAALWTDGRFLAPLMSSLPVIARCHGCKVLYWESDAPQRPQREGERPRRNPDLSITEYLWALREGVARNASEEVALRLRARWRANDVLRCTRLEENWITLLALGVIVLIPVALGFGGVWWTTGTTVLALGAGVRYLSYVTAWRRDRQDYERTATERRDNLNALVSLVPTATPAGRLIKAGVHLELGEFEMVKSALDARFQGVFAHVASAMRSLASRGDGRVQVIPAPGWRVGRMRRWRAFCSHKSQVR